MPYSYSTSSSTVKEIDWLDLRGIPQWRRGRSHSFTLPVVVLVVGEGVMSEEIALSEGDFRIQVLFFFPRFDCAYDRRVGNIIMDLSSSCKCYIVSICPKGRQKIFTKASVRQKSLRRGRASKGLSNQRRKIWISCETCRMADK